MTGLVCRLRTGAVPHPAPRAWVTLVDHRGREVRR